MKKYNFEYPVPKEYDIEKDYYEKGVIRKSDLIDGIEYIGICRNAERAVWNATDKVFVYDRYKFGMTFDDYVNHIEDDDGFDVFVPIKEFKPTSW